jgi:hypothetical protein
VNRKTLRAIALGFGGLLLALLLTVGAFALAGQDIAQPAGVPVFTTTPSPDAGEERTESPSPEHERSETPKPSVDDDGGASGDSTSGGSSGSDDGGGSGGHDSSGSGSDESGGSDDGSGSGSGEHDDD